MNELPDLGDHSKCPEICDFLNRDLARVAWRKRNLQANTNYARRGLDLATRATRTYQMRDLCELGKLSEVWRARATAPSCALATLSYAELVEPRLSCAGAALYLSCAEEPSRTELLSSLSCA